MASATTIGQTANHTKETGLKIKWTDLGRSLGEMAKDMKVIS